MNWTFNRFLTEKFDGVRAIWNPKMKQFVLKSKKTIEPPEWIIQNLPNIYLDGELW